MAMSREEKQQLSKEERDFLISLTEANNLAKKKFCIERIKLARNMADAILALDELKLDHFPTLVFYGPEAVKARVNEAIRQARELDVPVPGMTDLLAKFMAGEIDPSTD